jgi:hypothetical protein
MTDRRPLGTGTNRTDLSRTPDTDPVPTPRAQLAAERASLPLSPPAEPKPRPTAARRRTLGTGPTPAHLS